ncbi:MAG TPA: hypothetical protein PKY82_02535 [Pyrinomonadaceae bacterium]|nr:hypothetical protein [Pyrinomonadaceae bacterium]
MKVYTVEIYSTVNLVRDIDKGNEPETYRTVYENIEAENETEARLMASQLHSPKGVWESFVEEQ